MLNSGLLALALPWLGTGTIQTSSLQLNEPALIVRPHEITNSPEDNNPPAVELHDDMHTMEAGTTQIFDVLGNDQFNFVLGWSFGLVRQNVPFHYNLASQEGKFNPGVIVVNPPEWHYQLKYYVDVDWNNSHQEATLDLTVTPPQSHFETDMHIPSVIR